MDAKRFPDVGTASNPSIEVYPPPDHVVGKSATIRAAVEKALLLAQVDAPVLLHGETGVGKELFARAIHDNGTRRGPFVVVNCGGLPRDLLASELFGYVGGAFTGARRTGMVGKVEAAQHGTLFLDEIAEMPIDLQPYLLRVLEGGEFYPVGSVKPRTVQFRLIAACNRDLHGEVKAGRFRADLFYRVSVTTLRIPSLRERIDDIPDLVEHFSREIAEHHGIGTKRFSVDVLKSFASHSWPGNLRELRNVVANMALLTKGDYVEVAGLPDDVSATPETGSNPGASEGLHEGIERIERDAIDSAVRSNRGNLTRVAKDLRISKSTLYLKMKKYGLGLLVHEARGWPAA